MKLQINKIWCAALVGVIFAATIAAQTERRNGAPEREQIYIVSAKAGGVNYAAGAVRVIRAAGLGQTQILAKGDELNDRDKLTLGATGKTEILLNPGSFLRLAENTELEFTNTDLESLKLKLTSGSALIEAVSVGGEGGADISIVTPQTIVTLEKSGIYRVNANQNGTEIYVWKGAARVGNEIIKAGRKQSFGKNGVMLAAVKFDKDDARDALDIWSRDRAKELAKLNLKLERRALTNAFSGYALTGSRGGYWVYNRLTGGYCYVPFGNDNWGSPYGYWFNQGIYWNSGYRNPVVIAQPRPVDDTRGFTGPPIRLPGKVDTTPTMPATTDLPSKTDKGN